MHVLLITIGTDGDVFPYVGLGTTLRSRGHKATLISSDNYAGLAAEHGLDFQSLLSHEEINELLTHPHFWHPVKTARLCARWGVRYIRRQYELLEAIARDQETVLIANTGVFAAGLVHEMTGRPWVSLVLQPGLIPSSISPPVMPMFAFPRRTPRPLLKLFWRLLDAAGHVLVGRHLNQIRHSLGLPRGGRIFQTWLSKDLAIAMFPAWYGPPQPDWPPQLKLAGFPMFEGAQKTDLPAEVELFCQGSKPTIVFTFGTGMMHAAELFKAGVEACGQLGVQGLLLTRHGAQVPPHLPPFVRHCEFASFQALFPRCAAVVHHGGIGTVAKALTMGTPQLIVPFAFDQMDNAARVKHLGVGQQLKRQKASSEEMAAKLAQVLELGAHCRAVAARILKEPLEPAFEIASKWIEEMVARHALTARS